MYIFQNIRLIYIISFKNKKILCLQSILNINIYVNFLHPMWFKRIINNII